MNRYAKASSAGSPLRQGSRLGATTRGAFAALGAFDSPKASGAPAVRLMIATAAALIAFVLPAAASADPTAPSVISFGAGPVEATSAELHGEVNPRGSDTTYWFESGTSDCSLGSCQKVPASEKSAGSAETYSYLSQHLAGLSPQTTYHFRIVAENAGGTTPGTDQVFTTPAFAAVCPNAGALGTNALPDCRAYELVSQADKQGGEVAPSSANLRAAADGDAIEFPSIQAFGDARGLPVISEYIAERTAQAGTQGWSTHSITPKAWGWPRPVAVARPGTAPAYLGEMSPDLSAGVYSSYRALPEVPSPDVAGIPNLYSRKDLRTPGAGSYQLLTDPGFPVEPPNNSLQQFTGASADFSDVIFESERKLAPDAPDSGEAKLYENRAGSLELAGRIPPEGDSECDDSGSSPCLAAASSQAGLGAVNGYPTPNMISADGSRVFFQAPAGEYGAIYMRVDGTKTVRLSPGTGRLWTASTDGDRVFFSESEKLYMYEADAPAGERLTLISKDEEPADNGDVTGVVGASDDGSYVYFTTSGQLVSGQPASSGGRNILVWHDGEVHQIGGFQAPVDSDVATLRSSWTNVRNVQAARVSADGTALLFMVSNGALFQGRGGLAAVDHGSCDPNYPGAEPCFEFYVYDALSGRLRCASCSPSGEPPIAEGSVGKAQLEPLDNFKDAIATPLPSNQHQARALSADGRFVFFSSPRPLLPEDTNGRFDAYEYDTDTSELHLLSSGTDGSDSYVAEVSADGHDAFIVTREPLSGWDIDSAYDIYDARVDGGLPEPTPRSADCAGESCRAAVPPAPGPASVGSVQAGAGNPHLPKACLKGKLRKHGRCVKKHKSPSGKKHHAKKQGQAGSNSGDGK